MHSRAARSVHSTTHFSDPPLHPVKEHYYWDDMSSRPKSMSDFQSLIDASTPLHALNNGQPRHRSKPSLSLAAGLMMTTATTTTESPRNFSRPSTPATAPSAPAAGPWSENLFYAYAQKVYTTVPGPFAMLAPARDP
jgi:hypothetical protein